MVHECYMSEILVWGYCWDGGGRTNPSTTQSTTNHTWTDFVPCRFLGKSLGQ